MSNVIEFRGKDKKYKSLEINWHADPDDGYGDAFIDIIQEETRIVISPDQALDIVRILINKYQEASEYNNSIGLGPTIPIG